MLSRNQPLDCRNPEVLTELYEELRPYALKKCQYLLADINSAQDIVQDVFEKLWCSPVIFPDIASAYQWIYKSCHHASIDRLRTSKRRGELLAINKSLLFPEPKTPQDRLANRETLVKVLGHLSDREAIVLAYVVIDGLAHHEIAVLMDVSVKTIQRTMVAMEQKLAGLRSQYYE